MDGIMVDEVALEQGFIEVFSIPPLSHIHLPLPP
jgi:hypothetical protein